MIEIGNNLFDILMVYFMFRFCMEVIRYIKSR